MNYEVTCIGCGRTKPFTTVFPLGWHIVNGFHGRCPKCQLPAAPVARRQGTNEGRKTG